MIIKSQDDYYMVNDKTILVFSIMGIFGLIFSLVALTNSITDYNDLENKPDYSNYWNSLSDLTLLSGLNDGLVLWLPLNDGSGNASDYSGFMNHGLINGASWVDGKYGKALSFDGSSDYVSIPYNASLHPASITLCAWVKLEQHTLHHLIMRPTSGDGYWLIVNKDTGRVYFGYRNADGSDWKQIISTGSVTWGQWTFIYGGMIPASANGKRFVGINTVYEEFAAWQSRRVNIQADIHIGLFGSFCAKGVIDEVRIYNRALNVNEISVLYNLP